MATFTTLEQLQTVATSITTKADLRYRKLSDSIAKTDLASALSTEISDATSNISTLQGSDTSKSARTIAAEEVAKVVASAPASFDTLKEIADWIENDTTGAAKMANDIEDLKDKTELGTHEVSGDQVEYDTVKDYVEAYVAEQIGDAELTAGNGIDITNGVVSADVVAGNGLSVGSGGIAMAVVSASTSGVGGSNGAMTAADKEKLDSADVTAYTAGNGIAVANHVVSANIDASNARGLSAGASGLALALATPDVYTSGSKTSDGTAGAMSSADKYKLDNMTVATSQEITDLVNGLWAS